MLVALAMVTVTFANTPEFKAKLRKDKEHPSLDQQQTTPRRFLNFDGTPRTPKLSTEEKRISTNSALQKAYDNHKEAWSVKGS